RGGGPLPAAVHHSRRQRLRFAESRAGGADHRLLPALARSAAIARAARLAAAGPFRIARAGRGAIRTPRARAGAHRLSRSASSEEAHAAVAPTVRARAPRGGGG